MISVIGRYDLGTGPLCNKAPGGVGGDVYTDEMKEIFSKKYSGEGNPFYGKHHTEETLQKLRGPRGPNPKTKGRVLSEEWKEKLRGSRGPNLKLRGRVRTDEYKAKMSASIKAKHQNDENYKPRVGKKHSEESKQKMSDKLGKTYLIQTPDGIVVTINNLRSYCEKQRLNYRTMYNRRSSKGYKVLQRIEV